MNGAEERACNTTHRDWDVTQPGSPGFFTQPAPSEAGHPAMLIALKPESRCASQAGVSYYDAVSHHQTDSFPITKNHAAHREQHLNSSIAPACLALALLLLTFFTPSDVSAAPTIFVAYPPENYSVPYDHVLLEGSVPAGATFQVDGRAIDVGRDGLFIEWLPLKPGLNVLQLTSTMGTESARREFRVTSAKPQPLPAVPTSIAAGSIKPDGDFKLHDLGAGLSSRTLSIAFAGSPGSTASFRVGERGPFPMLESGPLEADNSVKSASGKYAGSFVINPGDQFTDAPITVTLRGADGQTATATAPGKLTVSAAGQLRVGSVTTEVIGLGVNAGASAARNGPGRSHILQLKPGIKLPISGEEADTYRVPIAPGQHVNVLKEQVRLLPTGAPLPRPYLTRIETKRLAGSTQIRFLLPERVAFSVEQSAAPDRQYLDVRLYGTESDVDYMVSDFPDDLVRDLRWTQEQDGVFKTRIELKPHQQWGYYCFYDGSTLVVQIKHPPHIDRARPLHGRPIVIDAGHGGAESGAAGALRVPEKDIVLLIARRLAEKLRSRGAVVTLSRQTDVTVPLYERPLLAEKIGAEVLMSIHANALPDGVDPATRRGSSVHYFHPQARALADTLLASLLQRLPEIGNNGIHYQNLALTRPTSQLSVLVETAYMTDKSNLRLLMSESGRERFAESLARGLEEFYRALTASDK